MLAYLKLIRFSNLLIIALTQYIIRFFIIIPILKANNIQLQTNEFQFLLIVSATVFIAAGGYVINDYFDRKTDTINRPERVIVGTNIPINITLLLHTIFTALGIGIGIYISYVLGIIQLSFIYFIISGILWFYSTSYKKQFFIGNLIISLLTALVPMLPAFYEIILLNATYNDIYDNYWFLFSWICGFAYFAFITTLVREIIKDIEDFEGDEQCCRNTFPRVIGIVSTKIVLTILIFFIILSLWYIFASFLSNIATLVYFSIGLTIPLIILTYKIIIAKHKQAYRFASNFLKIIMIIGIFFSVIIKYFIIN